MSIPARRTGGQILVDQLTKQGVERLTCVPGESYLAVLDALHDAAIDVLVRQLGFPLRSGEFCNEFGHSRGRNGRETDPETVDARGQGPSGQATPGVEPDFTAWRARPCPRPKGRPPERPPSRGR